MNFPYATFRKRKTELVGMFTIFEKDGKQTFAKARSGQPGYQGTEWQPGRSPIPQSKNIVGEHRINLDGYTPGDTSACGDTFFAILPDPTYQKGSDGMRSEIGIHSDANFDYAPGTAGCIGIHPSGWAIIRDKFKSLFKSGVKTIPLIVEYF